MSEPRVFVTRSIPEGGLALIREACNAEIWPEPVPPSRETLLDKVQGVDGLLSLLTDPVDAEVMDAAGPDLKVISNYAVGYDNIDVTEATARGIPIGHTPGVLTETTADMAFALLMAAGRRIVEGADYVRAGFLLIWRPTRSIPMAFPPACRTRCRCSSCALSGDLKMPTSPVPVTPLSTIFSHPPN